ncbi:MAG: hypothetical protein L0I24_16850, partial [Pseudonocardia sp.]|nr:hypothetical protein [Pseudonocardia sp.]
IDDLPCHAEVVAELRAMHAHLTLIATWIGFDTWPATFDYLRDHHAELAHHPTALGSGGLT